MEHAQHREVDKYSFYNGLMLAIGTIRDEFVAEGKTFHRAFYETIQYAQTNTEYSIEGASWISVDPIFGVVSEAHEMLLEAEEDRLIALLNPELQKARFRINKEQAEEELQTTEAPEWFLSLAKYFNDRLTQSR